MRMALLGPPASGKGTQASRLAEREGLLHLSTGDLLRAAVEAGTELGSEAQPYMERGELVPDELVLQIVRAELPGQGNFVLDGFPRTLAQFEALDEPLDVVVVLEIPFEEAVRRVTGRRVCPDGHVYHLDYDPPEEPGTCDLDGQPLRQREDDTEDVVRTRWRSYEEQTVPL
ncbi:MAG: nucleoside monophosphate kinase, partial [Nitriliruptorales bacterium]|nr:nucleoside monophosphate kinase [Nitriliruptorales bacterium]